MVDVRMSVVVLGQGSNEKAAGPDAAVVVGAEGQIVAVVEEERSEAAAVDIVVADYSEQGDSGSVAEEWTVSVPV